MTGHFGEQTCEKEFAERNDRDLWDAYRYLCSEEASWVDAPGSAEILPVGLMPCAMTPFMMTPAEREAFEDRLVAELPLCETLARISAMVDAIGWTSLDAVRSSAELHVFSGSLRQADSVSVEIPAEAGDAAKVASSHAARTPSVSATSQAAGVVAAASFPVVRTARRSFPQAACCLLGLVVAGWFLADRLGLEEVVDGSRAGSSRDVASSPLKSPSVAANPADLGSLLALWREQSNSESSEEWSLDDGMELAREGSSDEVSDDHDDDREVVSTRSTDTLNHVDVLGVDEPAIAESLPDAKAPLEPFRTVASESRPFAVPGWMLAALQSSAEQPSDLDESGRRPEEF